MIGVRVSADQQLVVVGSPGYFAHRDRLSHPRDLHAHDCINLRSMTSGSVVHWRFRDHGNDFEIAVDGRIVTSDGAVLVDAAVVLECRTVSPRPERAARLGERLRMS